MPAISRPLISRGRRVRSHRYPAKGPMAREKKLEADKIKDISLVCFPMPVRYTGSTALKDARVK